MEKGNILYIVVPCYNEEEVLPETSRRLAEKLSALTEAGTISAESRILFVDDGSRDKTWKMIGQLVEADERFCGVKLSRNRGHQNALLAGLMTAKEFADMIVSMDADLQDDINAVDEMIEHYYNGSDIVYGVRSARDTDTAFKRSTAGIFYKLMNFLGAETVDNHADYRLMSRRAVEALSQYKEVNLFLRGIVPLVGYKSSSVFYRRSERFAGESKYPLKKMLSFAMDGVTSFSVKPLRFITLLGFIILALSLLALLYTLIAKICGFTVPGWASISGSLWLLGGIQLLCLGVIGEYIGKIYSEVKERPRYFIETFLHR